jgi:hypothetical protein
LKYYYILKIEYCNYTIAIKSPDVDTQPSQWRPLLKHQIM